MATFNVSDNGGLATAMDGASPGDEIIMADGSYELFFNQRQADYAGAGITLKAANQHGALLNVGTYQGSGVTFDGLEILSGALFSGASNVTIKNGINNYLRARDSNDFLLQYNLCIGFHQLEQVNNNRWEFDTNLFDTRTGVITSNDTDDHLQIQGGDSHKIIRNYFRDRYIAYVPGTNEAEYYHVDHFQGGDEVGNITNLELIDNYFFDDGSTTEPNKNLWVIMVNVNTFSLVARGNIICGQSPNGFFIRDKDGNNLIEENLVIAGPQNSVGGGCPIRLKSGGVAGATVRNNLVQALLDESGLANNISGNIENVSGAAHLDWTNGGARIEDFVPNPGGIADVNYRWRQRLDAVIAGTEPYWDLNTRQVVLPSGGGGSSVPVLSGQTLNLNYTIG